MHDHAGVLQQRVEIAAVFRGWKDAIERIRRGQHEQQEPEAHDPHNAQHASDQRIGQVTAEARNREAPAGQHQHPEQQRAFVRAPRGREPICIRKAGVRIRRDIGHREVVVPERPCKARERERDERELCVGERARDADPRCVATMRTGDGQRPLQRREQQREDEREGAELGDHRYFTSDCAARRCADSTCALPMAAAASGGM
jgi:hypothetical protein